MGFSNMKYYKRPLEEIQLASQAAFHGGADSQTIYSFGWKKHPELEEYIAIVDGDHVVPENWVETTFEALEQEGWFPVLITP